MSNPAALVRRVGEPSEYQLLREVLRRKLIKVSPALYPNITLDQILAANGVNNMYPYQDHPLAMQVNMGATLAGVLFRRGEVKYNIKNRVPMGQWGFETALAYFCSNSNDNISFSSYFRQTRARLYLAAYAKYENRATNVQKVYMLACAEENGNKRIQDRGFKPTHYRERFIHELLQSPKDFDICTQNRNKAILKDMRQLVESWKSIEANFDPNNVRHQKLAEIGPALIEFFEAEHMVKDDKPDSIPGVSPTSVIELDVTKYQPFTADYRILTGLLKAMQGFRTYETVDILAVDDIADGLDGLKVSNDIGMDVTPVEGPARPVLHVLTMPEVDLSRLGDVVTLNFD
ncbi:hypothetical protein J4E81_002828 [Alternaria sp. BMP 2799]|nr:hypothetical protein J4E81_002828 [Alternaria sp. BMP 2799]